MKKSFGLLAFAMIVGLSFSGCTNELETQQGNKGTYEVKFVTDISSLSRTSINEGSTNTSFTAQDAIGIFAYDGEKTVGSNIKYVYDGSKWTSDNAIAAKAGVQYKYYAYYPYKEGVTDPKEISVTVNADQSNGISTDDFLTAQNETSAPGAETVSLKFDHAFSLVQVDFNLNLEESEEQPEIKSVTLENILPTVTVNAVTGEISESSGNISSIKMEKAKNADLFRAIVPAQALSSYTKIMSIDVAGTIYDVRHSAEINYKKGEALQITVNSLIPLPTGDQINITKDIKVWYKGGEEETTAERIYTDLVPLKLADIKDTDFKILAKDPNQSEHSESFWFAENQKSSTNATTYKVSKDDTYGNVIEIDYKGSGTSWYNNLVGYYNPNKENIIDPNKIYTLSFKAKAGSGTPAIWTCIKLVSETYYCTIENATVDNILKEKNQTFNSFTLSTEWKEYSCNFKFSLLGDNSGSGTKCTAYKTWEQISTKDYYINLAPRNVDTKFFITDIKLIEKE